MKKITLLTLLILLTAFTLKVQYQKLGYYRITDKGQVWDANTPKVQSMADFKINLAKAKKSSGFFGRDSTKYKPGFKYRTIDVSYGSGDVTLIAYKYNQGSYEWQAIFKMDALKFSFEQWTEDIWINSDRYRMAHVNDYTDSLNRVNNKGRFVIGMMLPNESKAISIPVSLTNRTQ